MNALSVPNITALILDVCRGEWARQTIEPITDLNQTESGNPLIRVYAKHPPSNRTTSVFSVAIKPPSAGLVASQPAAVVIPDIEGMDVPTWESLSLPELQKHLSEVLALPVIQQRIQELGRPFTVRGNLSNAERLDIYRAIQNIINRLKPEDVQIKLDASVDKAKICYACGNVLKEG